jgi:hypothetical protein
VETNLIHRRFEWKGILKKSCATNTAWVPTGQPTSWTAPAKRSGDGAFERSGVFDCPMVGERERGVALRLPPQSKIAIRQSSIVEQCVSPKTVPVLL